MSVFIAMPMGDGKCAFTTASSLSSTFYQLGQRNIACDFGCLPGNSLIDQARNTLLDSFLKSDMENLFWIDADVGWKPDDFFKVLEAEPDIVCGVYPMKKPQTDFPTKLIEPINREGDLVELWYAPGGFTRMRRSVIEKMIDEYGEARKCIYPADNEKKEVYHFYSQGIGLSGEYCGEDVAFSNALRSIGYQIWGHTGVNLSHTGFSVWRDDFNAWVGGHEDD